MAATRMRRTGGFGQRKSSFQTPSRLLLGAGAPGAAESLAASPAAALIFASRAAASRRPHQPRLERLFLWMTMGRRSEHELSHIKIGHAPNLRLMGHWQPEHHELEIGNTIIKAGTKMSASTMVPSVQILALEVKFEVRDEVKMVPCFLKCFPNVETLHVFSGNSDKPSGKVNLKLWQEAGYIECVQRHVKKFVFQEFRGKRSELAFLNFIVESALVLEKMVVMVASKYSSSVGDVNEKLQPLTSAKWASENCKLIIDPFDLITAGAERTQVPLCFVTPTLSEVAAIYMQAKPLLFLLFASTFRKPGTSMNGCNVEVNW
ncbi:hypothetical protein ACP70R_042810 [Stipagrostis hirtigluma subsp. patula]